MNKKYKKSKKIIGNGLLKDIFNKTKDIVFDKGVDYIKSKQIISKGLAALSLAQPELAPVTAPLSAVSSFFGFGKMNKPKKLKMKKLKLMM